MVTYEQGESSLFSCTILFFFWRKLKDRGFEDADILLKSLHLTLTGKPDFRGIAHIRTYIYTKSLFDTCTFLAMDQIILETSERSETIDQANIWS